MESRSTSGAAVNAATAVGFASSESIAPRTQDCSSALSVPGISAEVVECGVVVAPAQALEGRGGRIDLRAIGCLHRARVALDVAVLNVHAGFASEHAHALRGDAAVGDVNLAAVLSAHRIPIELQIPIVDLVEAVALTDDRLMQALD